MADEFLRSKLYEYGANSNLVLESERDGRRRGEAGKGEVESLRGRLGTFKMGDRLKSSSLSDVDGNPAAKRAKYSDTADASAVRMGARAPVRQQTEAERFLPKSPEGRAAFEELLVEVRRFVGDLPHEALLGATVEVLTVLKNSTLSESQKTSEIKSLIGHNVSSLAKLASISHRITEFGPEDQPQAPVVQAAEEEMAVAFDEDDDDNPLAMLDDDHSDEEDGDEKHSQTGDMPPDAGLLRGQVAANHTPVGGSDQQSGGLSVHDIDAYWLQRQLSKYYDDPSTAARLAEEALGVLSTKDERLCENQLVLLLGFDKFELIKLLLRNRSLIFYCTCLKQAQTPEERAQIEQDMLQDVTGGGPVILDMLKGKLSVNEKNSRLAATAELPVPLVADVGASAHDRNGGESKYSLNRNSGSTQEGKIPSSVSKLINLDDYIFTDGSHLLSSSQCTLPEQSWRAQKKGYEEVHIPALKPSLSHDEKLVQVTDLPDWMHPVFEGMKGFNRVQSKLLSSALEGQSNMLLCAPTGSGKTNVALLCMLGMISRFRDSNGSINVKDLKIVYVAPMKALVQECVLTFGKRLAPLSIVVKELSGDQSLSKQEILDTQVIVTTPEKWDVVTRKVSERSYAQAVRLVIIDEVHLLHDDRGPVLEALVARIIRQSESSLFPVRIVGLSATLPNYKDVAAFLRVSPQDLHFFDNSYRPVPLQQQFIGVMEKKALKRMQLMNEICYEKSLSHGAKNQILIFTHSRADTVKTAMALRDMATANDTLSRFLQEGTASYEVLKGESENAKNPDLKELLSCGFAVHHAGLSRSDRTLVEDLFADKHIKVLVSTATLAWGVNLPCRTVIIKGTQMYSPSLGRWTELSPLDILQMMGRAGRFGLDSEGEGIIITNHSELQYYLSLMNQQLPIESHLVGKLPDLLNAEIVLGSVSSLADAVEWLGYSYFFVRMLRVPSLYGSSAEDLAADSALLRSRGNFAHAALSVLEGHGLVKYDRRSGSVVSTALGRIASYYYLTAESAALYSNSLRSSMSEVELFRLFSMSSEFKQIHVREEEKIELRSLLQRVPIPIKESVEEPTAKINTLLQAYISRLKLEGFALSADMLYIQQSACRILRAMFEISLKKEWSTLSLRLLDLCIIAERRMWKTQSALRQFTAIPDIIVKKLEKVHGLSWEKYCELSPQDLGELVKLPKMGKTLFKFVHMVPKLKLAVQVYPLSRSMLRFEVTSTVDFEMNPQVHGGQILFWLLVEDADRERILYSEPFLVKVRTVDHFMDFTVPLFEPKPPHYFITVTSDRWLHSASTTPISFKKLVLPPKFSPPSELLDLQALPVNSFKDPRVVKFFAGVQYLNPIQTQVQLTLFESNNNALVCAPHGSGKMLCAELAILRTLLAKPAGKIVCILCNQDQAELRYADWQEKFSIFDASVALLEGDQVKDLESIKSSNIILSSPVVWESLSRKWRQRKIFKSIMLFVFNDLHAIGGENGATLEIALCRTRFMISQLQNGARMVGLSHCIANARDLGDVIGAGPSAVFNFAPNTRPTALDVRIQGMDEIDLTSRQQVISKPVFRVVNDSGTRRTLIFAPSRRQAQMLAVDLISLKAAVGGETGFYVNAKALELMTDSTVLQMLSHGIGILHESMDSVDSINMQRLFDGGAFHILIVPFSMAFKVSCWAHNVILMDSVTYDGSSGRFISLRAYEIWQMVGRAGSNAQSGNCTVFCHVSQKERVRSLVYDLVPLESHLDHSLHDLLNAEVVAQTIASKADAVDFLTWTFYYRRLAQNPNYYNLGDAGHQQLSDHLSELVDSAVGELEECKCLSVVDDMDLSPLNLGMIAAFYGISYATVEIFASSVTGKSKIKAIVEILSAAKEVGCPLRFGEEHVLTSLAKEMVGVEAPTADMDDVEYVRRKSVLLLHAHFSRVPVSVELRADQLRMLKQGVVLVQALVDVISSQGWLKPALAAMEISQCIVQGVKTSDPTLMQVPYFDAELIAQLQTLDPPVETVYDLLDMDDAKRDSHLRFSPTQLSEIALFCNSYPLVQVAYTTSFEGEVRAGEPLSVSVTCSRDVQEEQDFDPSVVSKHYPFGKKEAWWLVVGDASTNVLFSIKRFVSSVEFKTVLEFNAPEVSGSYNLSLYLICDSYVGCDQEYELPLTVVA